MPGCSGAERAVLRAEVPAEVRLSQDLLKYYMYVPEIYINTVNGTLTIMNKDSIIVPHVHLQYRNPSCEFFISSLISVLKNSLSIQLCTVDIC